MGSVLFGVSRAIAIVVLASTTPSRPSAFTWPSGFFSNALDSGRVYYTGISSPTFTACMRHCHASLPLDDFDRLVAIEAPTAPSKDPFFPFGVHRTGTNCFQGCHALGTVGAPRVSHPHRAFTAPCASRACSIPDRPWGSPFRAFTLCRAVAPFGAPCPPDVWLPPPAPNRSPVNQTMRSQANRSPAPRSAGDQAPRGADPGQPNDASSIRLTRTIPCGTSSAESQSTYPATRQCRTPNGTSFVFRALLPAKSS